MPIYIRLCFQNTMYKMNEVILFVAHMVDIDWYTG